MAALYYVPYFVLVIWTILVFFHFFSLVLQVRKLLCCLFCISVSFCWIWVWSSALRWQMTFQNNPIIHKAVRVERSVKLDLTLSKPIRFHFFYCACWVYPKTCFLPLFVLKVPKCEDFCLHHILNTCGLDLDKSLFVESILKWTELVDLWVTWARSLLEQQDRAIYV